MTTELTRCPEDAISELCFSPLEDESNLLLVSSWDAVRLYDVDKNVVNTLQSHTAPVLSCCFLKGSDKCISGGLGRDVRLFDFARESDSLIGKHAEAVCAVRFCPSRNLILSGSWDRTVSAWDNRSHSICHQLNIERKVYAMSVTPTGSKYDKLVIGDSDKRLLIYDLRRLDRPEQIRENVVKHQIRCVQTFADGKGFAVGTVEGRVAYELFDPHINITADRLLGEDGVPAPANEPLEKPMDGYVFKCHRLKMQYEDILQYSSQGVTVTAEMDKIFPVNTIAFNKRFNTFATGGGDGNVAIWDGEKKKRLWRLNKPLPTAITSLAFSENSNRLAVAVSYDYSREMKVDTRLIQYAQIIVREYRYVYTTNPSEASLYHVVQPVLSQVSVETLDPETLALQVDSISSADAGLDPSIPKVTVTVDQRTGQVNVLVSPTMEEFVPRTPAAIRIQTTTEQNQPMPAINRNELARDPLSLPPPDSRAYAPSPAGVAIRTPAGMNFLPAGSIKTPNGDIYTPKGVSYSPGGTCYWPKGTDFNEEGYARTPAGTTYSPGGTGYGVSGHVYALDGTAYSPSGLAYTGWRGTYRWKEEVPPSPGIVEDNSRLYPELSNGQTPASAVYSPPTTPIRLTEEREQIEQEKEAARRREAEALQQLKANYDSSVRQTQEAIKEEVEAKRRAAEEEVKQLKSKQKKEANMIHRKTQKQIEKKDKELERVATEELERERREIQRRESLKSKRREEEQKRIEAELELEQARQKAEAARQEVERHRQRVLQAQYEQDQAAQQLADAERRETARRQAEAARRASIKDQRKRYADVAREKTWVQHTAQKYDGAESRTPAVYPYTPGGHYDPNLEADAVRRQNSLATEAVDRPTVPGESTVMYKVPKGDDLRHHPGADFYERDAKKLVTAHAEPSLTEEEVAAANRRVNGE